MKITEVSWRSRIGRGRPFKSIRRLKKLWNWSIYLLKFKQHPASLLLITSLLIVGGIEMNPGPITVMEISNHILCQLLDRIKGDNNFRKIESKWGIVCESIFSKNNLQLRQFVCNLRSILPQDDNEKYMRTTLKGLAEGMSKISEPGNLGQNQLNTDSLWGYLSTIVYSTNTMKDRKYLADFWRIGIGIGSLPNVVSKETVKNTSVTLTKERQKRAYEKSKTRQRKKKTGNKIVYLPLEQPILPPSSSGNSGVLTPEQIHNLAEQFNSSIHVYTDTVCQVCDKVIYKSLLRRVQVTETIKKKFLEVNKEISLKEILICCKRCHSNLTRTNPIIPSVATCNNLNLCDIPIELQDLSSAEIGLIKQVRAYMKIYLLCRGRGQKAVKGLTVHFPMQVQEVINCLPNISGQEDVVVIHQILGDICEPREITVRPKRVLDALKWLKINNNLYQNVSINLDFEFVPLKTVRVEEPSDTEFETDMSINIPLSYVSIGDGHEILQSSINQSNELFDQSAGKQCTAMAACFLAHCFVDNPTSWTREIADNILVRGNAYYNEKCNGNDFLNSDDVQGIIRVFGSFDVNMKINRTHLFELQGYLKSFPGTDCPRLSDVILRFVNYGYKYGILTCNQFSMGLFLDDEKVYFFDSHSRGKKGCVAANGKACVLKLSPISAANKLSYIVNRNCLPRNPLHADINAYTLTITPFDIETVKEIQETIGEPNSTHLSNTGLNNFMINDGSSESESDVSDNGETLNDFVQPFGKTDGTDCVIDRIDILEPEIGDILDQVTLNRNIQRPLNDYYEKFLDVLSFPHLFPDGKNGLNEFRKITITVLDYIQQRLMSSAKRFAKDIEYLFYALCKTDMFRARQKIAVCCSMKKQGDESNSTNVFEELGIRDPHIYMSSIRGSASYWKNYLGDLICMVKTLGIPTFFLTISFDDLNSTDCVNALYKAEYGYDKPDIDPSSLDFQTRKELLNSNPITAARHFSMRLTKFLSFLKQNGNALFGLPVADYSVRVEFQSRGSPHAHMLIWLKNAPDFKTPEGKCLLERNISCSLEGNIKDLVLKYQRHSHTESCNKNRNGECRFSFPKPICNDTVIFDDEDIFRNKGKAFAIKRAKEESMINFYHPVLLRVLKCNMDIQPVTSGTAIAFYIAKYISKSEPSEISSNVQDAIRKINESNIPMRHKMMKIANTIMRNRQVSAQEAAFRICHLFLRYSTRATVFIPAFRKENRIRMLNREKFANGIPEFHSNIIDRYMNRPSNFESMCLFEFAARFAVMRRKPEEGLNDDDVHEFEDEPQDEENNGTKKVYNLLNNKGRIFERTKAAVVKYPNFHPVSDQDSYYYSILLLYFPFRDETFCDNISPLTFFKNNYAKLKTNKDSRFVHMNLSTELDRALLRITDFGDEERDFAGMETQFEPNYVDNDYAVEPENFSEIFPPPDNGNVTETIRTMYSNLNSEQKSLFNGVQATIKTESPSQLLQFVSGAGGCGKSYMIHLLSLLIRNVYGQDSLLIAALSGKAAHLVGGSTLHRTFSLSIEFDRVGEYNKLGSKKLAELRHAYRNVKYIILDEVSMINYESFNMIHNRLCEIFNNDELFGGRSVLLFGDLMQLNPPRGNPIYRKPKKFNASVDLWRQFEFIELKQNMRQVGNDPLLGMCNRLRFGELTSTDIDVLQSRLISPNKPNFDEMEKEFQDCVRIVPTIAICNKYNRQGTKRLNSVVYKIKAYDTYGDGKNFGDEVEENLVPQKENKTAGLPNKIQLGVGSRVMLRRNLNVRKGLVNGATGSCVGFKWSINQNGPVRDGELPIGVFVKFDHMDEPELIGCCTVDYYARNHRRVIRRMVPLILAFAVTIHKFQGSTVSKCVIDLGSGLFTKGQAYVALSRCRTLNGIGIVNLDVSKLIKSEKFSPANEEAKLEMERLRSKHLMNLSDDLKNLKP